MLTFKKVYLHSQAEQRGLVLEFSRGATVVHAPNGFGKSALLKSLYEAFGAEPHSIDDTWRRAAIASRIDFEIGGVDYSIIKFGGSFGIFDSKGELLLLSKSASSLGAWLSSNLNFKLRMTNQKQETVTPPPSYAFAPFYVDQDKSWATPWVPFQRMYLPRSAQVLADYHSGIRPNAYYEAQAERDQLVLKSKEVSNRREGLAVAIDHVMSIESSAVINFNVADFLAETDRLVDESRLLQQAQTQFRSELADLADEYAQWTAHNEIARRALDEFNTVFEQATGHPVDVECPTCGHHYTNSIASRFEIAADAETLIAALQHGLQERDKIGLKLDAARSQVLRLEMSAARVRETLSTRRGDISLEQIVTAQGRNLAAQKLRQEVDAADREVGELAAAIDDLSKVMRKVIDRRRSGEIKHFFAERITQFSTQLDVRVGEKVSIARATHARGSEGPRGLAAYYYAFLHTARKYGSSAFCPIVVDSPNQQGQDATHLPAIVRFLVKERPDDSQLILAVEDAIGLEGLDAKIVRVGEGKNRLLAASQYQAAGDALNPGIAKMLQ